MSSIHVASSPVEQGVSIPTLSRVPERSVFGPLEALRGIAALLVACYHVAWLNPTHDSGLVRNSYLMVDMFFVMSGFVMCYSYGTRIGSVRQLQDFAVLRLARLYPLHLAMFGIFLAKELLKYGLEQWGGSFRSSAFTDNGGWAVLSNLVLVQALGFHDHLTFNAPSWSISTEFYTYLLFGVILLVIGASTAKRVTTFLFVSLASLVILLKFDRLDLNAMYDLGLFRCTMSFFLGAASFIAFSRLDFASNPSLKRIAPYVAVATATAGAVFLELKTMGLGDFAFPPLMAVLVIALAASSGTTLGRWLESRPLAHLGRISYSVYMVHFLPVSVFASILASGFGFETITTAHGQTLIESPTSVGTIALLLYLLVLLPASHATFVLIEEPFRRKSKAWVANRRAQQRAGAVVDAERLLTPTS